MNDIELNTKVVIIGNSGVGKTSICNRYFNNKFDEGTMPTYGTSYVTKVLPINNKRIKMMVRIIYSFGTLPGKTDSEPSCLFTIKVLFTGGRTGLWCLRDAVDIILVVEGVVSKWKILRRR